MREVLAVGLMSGTSGDGVSAAVVRLEPAPSGWPAMDLLRHITLPYPAEFKERLFRLFDAAEATVDEICRLNVLLAERFAEAARRVAGEAGFRLEEIDLIGSHGQTVHHLPPQEERARPDGVPSTLQLGAISVIAERTGVTTVGDFRLRDMAVGGEGAPLVPVCDWVLFRSPAAGRAIQNIGGIANVTVLPPKGSLADVFAFDTGPGNALIDEAVRHVTDGREEMDRSGRRAARGKVDEELVQKWLEDPYFRLAPPKSTGRERFGRARARAYIEDAAARGVAGDDLVATVTALTVESIALHYRRDVLPRCPVSEMIVGGGGAKNETLLSRLASALPGVSIVTHEAYGIPSDAKEAMAFALLAYLFRFGLPGNVPTVTGARKAVVLGTAAPGRSGRLW